MRAIPSSVNDPVTVKLSESFVGTASLHSESAPRFSKMTACIAAQEPLLFRRPVGHH